MTKLTEEELIRNNKELAKAASEEFQLFKNKFSEGKCFICDKTLDHYYISSPCMHWLLRPKGVDKKHFNLIFENFEYLRIQSFLRYFANSSGWFTNVNDYVERGTSNKVIENTIKFKRYEWSFSSSKGCFLGETQGESSKFPHYHFQMKIDERIFIKFGEFHLSLKAVELEALTLRFDPDSQFVHSYGLGMSFQEATKLMEDTNVRPLLFGGMEPQKDKHNANVHIEYRIICESDEMAMIAKLLQKEAERTGVSFYEVIKDIPGIKIEQIKMMPGPKAVEIARRKNKGKR